MDENPSYTLKPERVLEMIRALVVDKSQVPICASNVRASITSGGDIRISWRDLTKEN